jgi:hypothetical protein
VVKILSSKIPYSSPDHPLPCRSMTKARQATGTEHLEMSHHRIGEALNHICLPGWGVDISKALRFFLPRRSMQLQGEGTRSVNLSSCTKRRGEAPQSLAEGDDTPRRVCHSGFHSLCDRPFVCYIVFSEGDGVAASRFSAHSPQPRLSGWRMQR